MNSNTPPPNDPRWPSTLPSLPTPPPLPPKPGSPHSHCHTHSHTYSTAQHTFPPQLNAQNNDGKQQQQDSGKSSNGFRWWWKKDKDKDSRRRRTSSGGGEGVGSSRTMYRVEDLTSGMEGMSMGQNGTANATSTSRAGYETGQQQELDTRVPHASSSRNRQRSQPPLPAPVTAPYPQPPVTQAQYCNRSPLGRKRTPPPPPVPVRPYSYDGAGARYGQEYGQMNGYAAGQNHTSSGAVGYGGDSAYGNALVGSLGQIPLLTGRSSAVVHAQAGRPSSISTTELPSSQSQPAGRRTPSPSKLYRTYNPPPQQVPVPDYIHGQGGGGVQHSVSQPEMGRGDYDGWAELDIGGAYGYDRGPMIGVAAGLAGGAGGGPVPAHDLVPHRRRPVETPYYSSHSPCHVDHRPSNPTLSPSHRVNLTPPYPPRPAESAPVTPPPPPQIPPTRPTSSPPSTSSAYRTPTPTKSHHQSPPASYATPARATPSSLASPTSNSSTPTTGKAIQCAGYTRMGKRCKRMVKAAAPYIVMQQGDDAGVGVEGGNSRRRSAASPLSGKNRDTAIVIDDDAPSSTSTNSSADSLALQVVPNEANGNGARYCKDHTKQICAEEGFYWKGSGRDKWIRFEDWIPEGLEEQTRVLLRLNMEMPLTSKESPGFIYAYELRDLQTTHVSYYKVGRTDNVPRRMDEWKKRCTSHNPTLRDIFPLPTGPPSQVNASMLPGAMQGGLDGDEKGGRTACLAVKRLEKLIHIELAARSIYASSESLNRSRTECTDCGTVHQEIFPISRDMGANGWEYEKVVKETILRWEAYIHIIMG